MTKFASRDGENVVYEISAVPVISASLVSLLLVIVAVRLKNYVAISGNAMMDWGSIFLVQIPSLALVSCRSDWQISSNLPQNLVTISTFSYTGKRSWMVNLTQYLLSLTLCAVAFSAWRALARKRFRGKFYNYLFYAITSASIVWACNTVLIHEARYSLENKNTGRMAVDPGRDGAYSLVADSRKFVIACGLLGVVFQAALIAWIVGIYNSDIRGLGSRKDNSAQLALCLLVLDDTGHILVGEFGMPPTRVVTTVVELDPLKQIAHPSITWVLGNLGVRSLVDAIRGEITNIARLLREDEVLKKKVSTSVLQRYYIFSALFEITRDANLSIRNLGYIYDRTFFTRKGVFIFIVNSTGSTSFKEAVSSSLASWVPISSNIDIFANALGMNLDVLKDLIADIPLYTVSRKLPVVPRRYLATLVLRPTFKGLKVMVFANRRTTMPKIPISELACKQLAYNHKHLKEFIRDRVFKNRSSVLTQTTLVEGYTDELKKAFETIGIGEHTTDHTIGIDYFKIPDNVVVLRTPENVVKKKRNFYGIKHPKISSQSSARRTIPLHGWISPQDDSPLVELLIFSAVLSINSTVRAPAGTVFTDLPVFESMHYMRFFPNYLPNMVTSIKDYMAMHGCRDDTKKGFALALKSHIAEINGNKETLKGAPLASKQLLSNTDGAREYEPPPRINRDAVDEPRTCNQPPDITNEGDQIKSLNPLSDASTIKQKVEYIESIFGQSGIAFDSSVRWIKDFLKIAGTISCV